jgi:glucose/arabinose dehydrogenase
MNRSTWLVPLLLSLPASAAAQEPLPKPLVSGLLHPQSVAVGPDRRVYITEAGELDKDGDGRVLVIDQSKAVPLATGLDDPRGVVGWLNWLYVADRKRVWKIDRKGKAEVLAAEAAFPSSPHLLGDITVDEDGMLYVADVGDGKGSGGAVYRVPQKGKITLVADAKRTPPLNSPNGLVMDGKSFLLTVDAGSGELLRIKVTDGSAIRVADGFEGGGGLAWDWFGRLFISSAKSGKVWGIPRPGTPPVPIASGFQSAGDLCLDPTGKLLLVADGKADTVTALPTAIPGWEVDERPLPIRTALAFPDLQWTGWSAEADDGRIIPHRPLVLTHAGDGSNRVFVATQHGVIHVFPNDPKVTKTEVFLDIQKQVVYDDKQNEEGFLGLAFHPNYKETGEFFVFYTRKGVKQTNVVSRFRVSKDNPNRADPASEEELLRITRPFWNHDGGTICFGPDGYLYVALGDGGGANDPQKNGQNLKTLLAKVLRIDIDRKEDGKNYAVPPDNPFVGKADARPEIWAYGLRNIWRMAFDRKTGKLWASDVGQNLYEEIDIIVKGGNYGWSLREGLHPFSNAGVGPRPDLIEPIWEYHHDVGKSLTGGLVYRGRRLKELQGSYVYGDYITSKIWALRHDDAKGRVVANRPLADPKALIMSFGEDEQGEIYLLTTTASGKGIFQFVQSPSAGESLIDVVTAAGKSVPITEEAWKRLPRRKVEVKDFRGPTTYEGVPLAAVLGEAGIKLGKDLRGPRLAHYLVAECQDGFRVVFSLAELDPALTDQPVILADLRDGQPLDALDGPYRIIVPHERFPSRWARQVRRLVEQAATGLKK